MNEKGTPQHIETIFEGNFLVTNRRFDELDLRVTQTTEEGKLTDWVDVISLPLNQLDEDQQGALRAGSGGRYHLLEVSYANGESERIEKISPDPSQAARDRRPERTMKLLWIALQGYGEEL